MRNPLLEKITLPIRRSKILKDSDADAHYYDQLGNPRYDVTDVRQARKLMLFPSPTTKLNQQPAVPVVNWKVLNGMEAVLETPRRIPQIMPVGAVEAWDLPASLENPEFEIRVAGEVVSGPFATFKEALDGVQALRMTQPDLWEGEEIWGKRIGESYEEICSVASKFGSAFHAQQDLIARGQPISVAKDDPVYPFALKGEAWFKANIIAVYAVEAVIIDYNTRTAGTTDLIGLHRVYGLVFLDWKTQNIKKRDKKTGALKPEFYDKWCAQLGVYRSGVVAYPPEGFPVLDLRTAKCMNVVFDSNYPSDGIEHLWDEKDLDEAAETYRLCSLMYEHTKKYTPTVDLSAKAEVMARQPVSGDVAASDPNGLFAAVKSPYNFQPKATRALVGELPLVAELPVEEAPKIQTKSPFGRMPVTPDEASSTEPIEEVASEIAPAEPDAVPEVEEELPEAVVPIAAGEVPIQETETRPECLVRLSENYEKSDVAKVQSTALPVAEPVVAVTELEVPTFLF